MDVHAFVMKEIEAVAAEQTCKLAPLHDDMALLDTGLDSLCFAILEDALGFDPFASDEALAFPVTLGDFVRLYERSPA